MTRQVRTRGPDPQVATVCRARPCGTTSQVMVENPATMPTSRHAASGAQLDQVANAMDLEQALNQRRTVRVFAARTVSPDALRSVLWAAQGPTADGRRTTPSAGASHPLRLIVARGPDEAGTWTWDADTHGLSLRDGRDVRADLAATAIGSQPWVAAAPATLVICADTHDMLHRFAGQPPGDRGRRYVDIEVGAAAQNAALQATSLGLAGVLVGGFDDAAVAQIIGAGHLEPRLLFSLGHPG